MTTLIDLSHLLEPGMPAYPGLPVPQFHTYFTHAESLERQTYAPGTSFQIATYEIGGNTGTYVDAPFHRHPTGPDLAALPLDRLANLPGLTVKAPLEGPIGSVLFDGLDIEGKALMIHTGWAVRWGGDYFRSGPFLTADACEGLVKAGVALVGIDCANIDDMGDTLRPAHTILLAAGIPIVEHLTNLEKLPTQGYTFFGVPPAIRGGTSFPIRAFALTTTFA